jgi:hypothetical protein
MATTDPLARWTVTVPPAAPVWTPDELSSFLKLGDVIPGELAILIDAATDFAEDTMECSLIERTLVATFHNGEALDLPRGPVREIVSIAGAGDTSTDQFELRACGHGLRVILTASVAYPITVTYRAGYGSPANVPAGIRLSIAQHAGTMFRHRESVADKTLTPVPHSLEAFYRLKGRGRGIG